MEQYQSNKHVITSWNPFGIILGYFQSVWLMLGRIIMYPLELFFLSEKALEDELAQLDKTLAERQPVNRDEMPDLEVADMDKDHLTVNIKEKQGLRRSVSESGEDIQVVHEKQGPTTRSILKKRSVSESSDDLSATAAAYGRQYSSSGSPISESDENENGDSLSGDDAGGRKKSVSFNDRVQSATFKGNQSVSSMHQQLKNKRKKAKKHEKHAQKSRRRRSTNSFSEQSSDDVNDDERPRQNRDGGATAAAKPEPETTTKADTKSETKIDIPAEPSTTETVWKTKKGSGEKVKSNQDKIENNCKGTKKSETPTGNGAIAKVHLNGDVAKSSQPTECAQTNGDIQQNGDDSERTKTEYDSDDFDEASGDNEISGNGVPPKAKDPDAPETILNWQEQSAVPDELKPHCAVPLSNSIMFDLDVD